ncbi:hypothetical protein EGR_01047 [Echinococcus granulosus]|uniref:Uncharacterized protein n=1 Tax=Echinococcus granulosus TaxID=6210 RepID=W6VAW3_ECHGR|nr:hypothetical protein EGR_01047 [Echinococcus granulosus]EUB63919.1 hypothetical protein EGR_01047 [Echinococcus granulosus]
MDYSSTRLKNNSLHQCFLYPPGLKLDEWPKKSFSKKTKRRAKRIRNLARRYNFEHGSLSCFVSENYASVYSHTKMLIFPHYYQHLSKILHLPFRKTLKTHLFALEWRSSIKVGIYYFNLQHVQFEAYNIKIRVFKGLKIIFFNNFVLERRLDYIYR